MGLIHGRMSARRFRVEGTVPDGYTDTFMQMLGDLGFQDQIEGVTPTPERSGWVRHDNVMSADFSDINTWSIGGEYLIFDLRIDTRSVPPKLLAAKTRAMGMAWCEENGTERCPASVLTRFREDVKDQLMRRALPKMRTFEVVWNVAQGYLLFSTAADGICDTFRKRFYRTFGMKLETAQPTQHWLELPLAENMLGTVGIMGPLEFLTWFWWRSEEGDQWDLMLPHQDETSSVEGWVDGRLALASPASTGDKAVLSGDNPSTAPEARAALAGGKTTIEMMLGLRVDDREYVITLKGPYLDLYNAKFPIGTGDDDEAAIYERMYLYDQLHGMVVGLFTHYAELRVSSTWESETVPAMRDWVMSDLPAEESEEV